MGTNSRTMAIRLWGDSRSLASLTSRAAIGVGAVQLRYHIAVPHRFTDPLQRGCGMVRCGGRHRNHHIIYAIALLFFCAKLTVKENVIATWEVFGSEKNTVF